MKNELASLSTESERSVYLKNGSIGKDTATYWITFDITPEKLTKYADIVSSDPNSAASNGFNLLSIEPSFYPVSLLRVMITDSGAEIGIMERVGLNHIERYDRRIATLKEGEKLSFAIRVDPANGNIDVFIGGEYVASAVMNFPAEYNPAIIFHQSGVGKFLYENINIAREEY
jgi:hypothetical protein